MRLREITNNITPHSEMNEAWYSMFGFMRGIIGVLGIGQPIYEAYKNINQIKSQTPDTAQQGPLIDKELGLMVSKIAGILLASKVLTKTANFLQLRNVVKGTGSGLATMFDYAASLPLGAARTAALGAVYSLLNSEKGLEFLGYNIAQLTFGSSLPQKTQDFIGKMTREFLELIEMGIKKVSGSDVDVPGTTGQSSVSPGQGGQPAPSQAPTEPTEPDDYIDPNTPVPGSQFKRDPTTGQLKFKRPGEL